jgi:hypothetical protein
VNRDGFVEPLVAAWAPGVGEVQGNVDARLKGRSELTPILEATSRIVSSDVHSPSQTPVFDSSAMDGYAVASASTRGTSVEKPLALRVEGIIAGDDGSVWGFRAETDLIAYGCFTDVVKWCWDRVLQGRRSSRFGLNFI